MLYAELVQMSLEYHKTFLHLDQSYPQNDNSDHRVKEAKRRISGLEANKMQ